MLQIPINKRRKQINADTIYLQYFMLFFVQFIIQSIHNSVKKTIKSDGWCLRYLLLVLACRFLSHISVVFKLIMCLFLFKFDPHVGAVMETSSRYGFEFAFSVLAILQLSGKRIGNRGVRAQQEATDPVRDAYSQQPWWLTHHGGLEQRRSRRPAHIIIEQTLVFPGIGSLQLSWLWSSWSSPPTGAWVRNVAQRMVLDPMTRRRSSNVLTRDWSAHAGKSCADVGPRWIELSSE